MTIEQTIEIPVSRRLAEKAPLKPASLQTPPETLDCSLCAKYRDPETGELRFNAETIAAFEEGDAMLRGEIPAQRFNSLEELLADLRSEN